MSKNENSPPAVVQLTSSGSLTKPESGAQAAELVQRVQQHRSAVEVVYRSHDRWPLPRTPTKPGPDNASSNGTGNTPLRIAVLDSSFNPPTLAHYALIRARIPQENKPETDDYDARLLLLSVRNADKSLKAGDATYVQRLEMMGILARLLEEDHQNAEEHGAIDSDDQSEVITKGNTAVAIFDEPTFVRKSQVLRSFLRERITECAAQEVEHVRDVQLHFIMGMDTLERFFAPRYYVHNPPSGSSTIILTDSQQETLGLGRDDRDGLSTMHSVLQTFFSPPPVGDGSKVVCAHRIVDENPWLAGKPTTSNSNTTTSTGNTTNSDSTSNTPSQPSGDAKTRLKRTLEIANPYIDDGSVQFIDISEREQALSSSEVRARIAKGLEWNDMVLPRVASYIQDNGLYKRT